MSYQASDRYSFQNEAMLRCRPPRRWGSSGLACVLKVIDAVLSVSLFHPATKVLAIGNRMEAAIHNDQMVCDVSRAIRAVVNPHS
jgi:hypothetical protein